MKTFAIACATLITGCLAANAQATVSRNVQREVVRNLALRDHEKGLSTGEKQMFVKAKKILASELMYAKSMDEEQTHVWLDDVLSGSSPNGKRRAKAKVGASA